MFYIVYGYNIWVVPMVNVNGETSYSRAEKTEIYNDSYSRGSRYVGYQSEGLGNQQERVNRADSAELSCFDTTRKNFDSKTAVDGGSITQLIQETRQEIAQFEAHTSKLRDRLQKLSLLANQLGQIEEE